LTSAFDLLEFGILDIHVTLLISFGEGPIEYVVPVRLDNFFDTIHISIRAVRCKVRLCASVLPDWDCHVVDPLLFKPKTNRGHESCCVCLVLALVVKQGIC